MSAAQAHGSGAPPVLVIAGSEPSDAGAQRLVTPARMVTGVVALSITLVRGASAAPHKSLTISLVIVMFLACIFWAAPRHRRSVLLTGSALLLYLYGADVCIALIRGARDGAFEDLTSAAGKIGLYLATIGLGVTAVASAANRAERDERLMAIALAPAIYVVLNLLLAKAGFQSGAVGATAGTQSQLLGFVGVAGSRQTYPLATSINLYSIVASSAAAGLVVLRARSPESLPALIAWPAILICLYEVVSGDSRGTLAWALAVSVVFLVWRRFNGAPWIAALIPFFPLIVIGILHLVVLSGVGSALNRSGGGQTDFGSIATGTGRVFIWRGAWQVLSHFRLQDLIGWGAAGQIPSGASTHYAFVFPNDPQAFTAFTHNITLQAILDEGYIGLAILVAVIWRTLVLLARHLRANPRSPAVALAAMLLVIVLSGATEVSPSYYTEEVLLMVFLIAGAAVGLERTGPGGERQAPGGERTAREAGASLRHHL